ncbi:MAG TPA: preprotein translocase subunit YajC [Urbifossiella sp.]|jgi:preprotein translocase subunit YajC|nr:preprotein translocase subunit YajC [Urbifossiella sp.]
MLKALLAEDPPQQAPGGAPGGGMLLMFGVLALFWVIVILPMTRRQKKEQEKVLASISRGSKILTQSGIVGTVVTIKEGEDEIVIRSEDTKLRIKRSTVSQVLGTDAAEAAK